MQQSLVFPSAERGPISPARGRPKARVLRETTGISMLPDLKDKVDRWAHRHQVSRSRAIEILIDRALR